MIYADNNASIPLLPTVKKYLLDRLIDAPLGNPNSLHSLGQQVAQIYEKSREIISSLLGASSSQLIFNSGATEGISHIFHSLLHQGVESGKDILILSAIEHSAVIEAAHFYKQKGFQVFEVSVSPQGVIDLLALEEIIQKHHQKIALVSIMAANNETGVIQPYQEIGKICRNYKLPYLCDTTQLIGKVPFHFEQSHIDFAVMSGHKLGALPGSGFLLAQDPTLLVPLIHGGGQERGHRSGTQNYLGQETVAVALNEMIQHLPLWDQVAEQRKKMEKNLQSQFSKIMIFGEEATRLPGTVMLSYPGLHGQAVQIELESHNIFVTTSSACADNEPHPSHVLKAMGVNDAYARGAIRLSFSPFTTEKEFVTIQEILSATYRKLSRIASY